MTASPSDPHIGLVVEGPGDVAAVPVLLRKWLEDRYDFRDVLAKPISCNGRDNALAPRGLEGFVGVAASRPGCVGVMVILDGEGDLVCQLGPKLWKRAKSVTGKHVSVCLADKMFEDWIYCSAETLDLGLDYNASRNGIGAVVGALRPRAYAKPTWQPRLAARMDISIAAPRSSSLQRLFKQFERHLSFLDDNDPQSWVVDIDRRND